MGDYFEKTARPASGGIGTTAMMVRTDSPADIAGANGNYVAEQCDSSGAVRATEEGGKKTYFASSQFACDGTATDIAIFPGVAGVTAKLQFVSISGHATAAASGDLTVVRRSAVNTAGTAVNSGLAQADTRDAAPSCQPQHYTAHPTGLGATAGTLFSVRYTQPAPANLYNPQVFVDFRQWNGGKPVRVQGATDIIAINVPAALGGAGNVWDITWCWTEEATTA